MTMTFADLSLAPSLLQALAEEGYTNPTPIQAQSIPMLLQGRDMLGMAQTGTGKTAAFALPLLHRLATNPARHPRVAPACWSSRRPANWCRRSLPVSRASAVM